MLAFPKMLGFLVIKKAIPILVQLYNVIENVQCDK